MTAPHDTFVSTAGKLNPEVKAEWVAALRSGQYQQGKGWLHDADEDTYCCLGVLCEIGVRHNIIGAVRSNADDRDNDVYAYTHDDGFYATTLPPTPVADWAYAVQPAWVGRLWYIPGDPDPGRLMSLVELNDERDLTFAQIADLIEAFL